MTFPARTAAVLAALCAAAGAQDPEDLRFGVLDMALSGNGRVLARNEPDWVRILDVADKRVLSRLSERVRPQAIALSPDGSVVASINGEDKVILLRDVSTGKETGRIQAKESGVLRFSPDGKCLAFAGDSGVLDLWEVASGLKVRSLDVGRYGGDPFSFSPDGRLLASGGGGDAFAVWEVATGKRIVETARGFSAAFAPDSAVLAVGGGEIRFWDLRSGKEQDARRIPLHAAATALAFLDGGGILAVSDDRGVISLRDGASGRLRGIVGTHPSRVEILHPVPGGRFLVSVGEDGEALLWDLRDPKPPPSSADRPLQQAEFESLWDALAGPDGAAAVRTLAASPDAVVAFLKSHLKAATENPGLLERLVLQLDDDRYDVREKASTELARLGGLAEPILRRTLSAPPSEEVRSRVGALLQALSGAASAPLEGEALRISRALQLLELIGTPQAREVLETMASGASGARETWDAKAALDRLSRRK